MNRLSRKYYNTSSWSFRRQTVLEMGPIWRNCQEELPTDHRINSTQSTLFVVEISRIEYASKEDSRKNLNCVSSKAHSIWPNLHEFRIAIVFQSQNRLVGIYLFHAFLFVLFTYNCTNLSESHWRHHCSQSIDCHEKRRDILWIPQSPRNNEICLKLVVSINLRNDVSLTAPIFVLDR